MDKSDMLIDFNSPVPKNELIVPLIPVPPSIPSYSNEVDNSFVDPFEVKATLDPFEDVLKNAAANSNNDQILDKVHHSGSKIEKILINIETQCYNTETSNEEELEIKANPVSSNPEDNVLKETHSECDEILISIESECKEKTNKGNQLELQNESESPSIRDNVQNKYYSEEGEVLKGNETSKNCNGDLKNSQNINQVSEHEQINLKYSPKPAIVVECQSQSQTSTDFSTDESLKAVIAKRVNKCIQEVLNGSIKNNSTLKKPQNKRSLSFIGLSSKTIQKEPSRLNKSCTDVNSTELKDQQLEVSSDSSGFGVLSPNSTDVSAEGIEEEKVFKEARKLSRTFSKLAESLRQEQESESDDEDLLSCKPRWLYTDSSDDEEEKLLKDPKLNLRRRSGSPAFTSSASEAVNTKVSDSPALQAFKSRRSFTHLQAALDDTQEETTLKRSVSVGSQMKHMPAISNIASLGPVNFIKTDDQPLKLKKNFGVVKKGPLRAVMPIQSMTKEPFSVAGRISSKQDTSPEARYQRPAYAIGTPSKDNSQLNIIPMASSTPNKADGCANNISLPTRPAVVNKRHSLEGNTSSSHKSREALKTEEGSRPRSNSVNSSIPRVMQVKPFTGLPTAPKSTSSLLRTAKTPINVNNSPNNGGKKNTSKLKTNTKARVLADVKTKSPRQSKVRTAVNTISNLVKGKKSAAQDKENRVPV